MITISTGSSRKCMSWRPEEVTWEALTQRLLRVQRTAETAAEYAAMSKDERAEAKDVGGFVGGRLDGERRRTGAVKSRGLLVLDADNAPQSFQEAVCGFAVPWAVVGHTTHSHTPEAPRWRLVLPLKREVTADEYEAVARWVSNEIGLEYFDDTTYEPSRLMYWPSCPKDGAFESFEQQGEFCDPDWVLAQYEDWHDVASWPSSERAKAARRSDGRKQGKPQEKPGIVGAFCRVYDVPAAIEKYLDDKYRSEGGGRYTYLDGSTTCGMILLDDGDFCRSYHSTDPAQGTLRNAFDLVRIHLYGALDADSDEDTAINNLPSYAAMRELCRKDVDVFSELGGSTASEDFGADSGLESGAGCDQDHSVAFERFARNTLRYNKSLGWLAWDGKRWVPDCDSRARQTVMVYNDTVYRTAKAQAALEGDPKKRDRIMKAATALRSTSKINGLLQNAQALLTESVDVWDPDPWLLNTPAGVVDLKTGEMQPHDPALMMTGITSVSPERVRTPMWDKFLGEATGGDLALESYLQSVLGMALVGKVYNEGMLLVTGSGGNGKSTLFGTCARVLGSYADTVRPEIMLTRVNGGEVFGVEAVRGKRLCLMSETDQNAGMSVSMMKRLTSRDVINANPKHKQAFSFVPTHTLILHTNHLPTLRQFDEGTKRRLAVAVFPHTPKPTEVIVDLADQLYDREGGGILSWMIEGAVRFWRGGCKLDVPKSVADATRMYIESNEQVVQFLGDCCKVDPGSTARGGELYQAYRDWCAANGERWPKSGKVFAAELEMKGFSRKKTKTGSVWYGLELNCEECTE